MDCYQLVSELLGVSQIQRDQICEDDNSLTNACQVYDLFVYGLLQH